MRKLFLAFILFSGLGYAQITFSAIQPYAITHASVRWTFTATNGGCFGVEYGTTSGGPYPNHPTYYCEGTDGKASIAVGGLLPSTTYYFVLMATASDRTMAAPALSSEQTITTLPLPDVHPVPPIPPAPFTPSHPDFSGYNIVTLKALTSGTLECVASANYAAIGSGGGIALNDTIPAMLAKLRAADYGTVFEFPQGTNCIVPDTLNSAQYNKGSYLGYYGGYSLPVLSLDPTACGGLCTIDDPRHRWIVFRTKSINSGDFPPYGTRTGPEYSSRLAKLVAQHPSTVLTGNDPGKARGQIFDASAGGEHHFWVENMEWTNNGTLIAADTVDPAPYSVFFGEFPTYHTDLPTQYITLSGLYIHGTRAPARYTRVAQMGGPFQAMVGNYVSNFDYWMLGDFPANYASTSSNVLTIPASTYQLNTVTPTPVIGSTATATVTFNTTGAYTGHFRVMLGPNGTTTPTVYYTPATTGTISPACGGCTATPLVSSSGAGQNYNQQTDFPKNMFDQCSGDIAAAGVISNLACQGKKGSPTLSDYGVFGYGFGTVGVELPDGGSGPYYFDNNFLGITGQAFYVDAGGNGKTSDGVTLTPNLENDDVRFYRNHIIWTQDHRQSSATTNGFRYQTRNQFEIKRGNRWDIKGNIFDGSWAYQNEGWAIAAAGSNNAYAIVNQYSGTSDWSLTSNIIRHAAAGIVLGTTGGPWNNHSEPEIGKRFVINNNLLYDINQYKYQQVFHFFAYHLYVAAEDVNVVNNTFGSIAGPWVGTILITSPLVPNEGFSFQNNVTYLSQTGRGFGVIGYNGGLGPPIASIPAANLTNARTIMDTFFLAGPNPNYVWSGNVMIGGVYGDDSTITRDLTQTDINTISSTQNPVMPNPSADCYVAGNTLATREGAVSFTNAAAWDYRQTSASSCIPGDKGTNYQRLYRDQGLITAIQAPLTAATAAVLSYTAPDSRAVAVDVSSDGGATWTRTTDGGGKRRRSLTIGNLSSSTAYVYRILGYYRQVNDGYYYSEYLPDEITEGSFTTTPPPGPTFSVNQQFVLPSGATQAVVALTPLPSGSTVNNTCVASPCTLTGLTSRGAYSMIVKYQNAGGVTVSQFTSNVTIP